MIRLILKQLWTLRRRTAWLYAELLLCLCLAWYIVDYGVQILHNRFLPNAFDIEGVYTARYLPPRGSRPSSAVADSYPERIRRFPGVREVYASSAQVAPYLGAQALRGLTLDKTQSAEDKKILVYEKSIENDSYFSILGIRSIYTGELIRLNYSDPNAVVISRSLARYFFADEDPRGKLIDEAEHRFVAKGLVDWRVVDVCEDFKVEDYRLPVPLAFLPMTRGERIANQYIFSTDETFNAAAFSEEILRCSSLGELRQRREFWEGITKKEMMARTVTLFFVVSIALGVIGSFWFRTQQRRGELALRMTLGCSPRRLSGHIILEALILLLAAALPALVINYLVFSADLTLTLTKNFDEWWMASNEVITQDTYYWINLPWMRFLVGNLLTLGLMATVVVLSVWIPARKAAQIQPVEALGSE